MELKKITDTVGIEFSVLMDIVDQIRGPVTITNVIQVSTKLMGLVGKVKNLDGQQKKFVVIQLLMYFVNNTGSGKIDAFMDSILINVIPAAIDKLVEVEKGNLVFNADVKEKVTPHAKSLWAKIKKELKKLKRLKHLNCRKRGKKEKELNVVQGPAPMLTAVGPKNTVVVV